ncbi:MAG: acyl carrier protein [Alphaproteobacteria bacterium]|nr:acyl carrier protein [Alphaproteobacteria bacterium]
MRRILTVGPGEINGCCLLRDDIGMDSIDIVELILHLGKTYHIEFTPTEEDRITDMTVNQVVELVYSKCNRA